MDLIKFGNFLGELKKKKKHTEKATGKEGGGNNKKNRGEGGVFEL